jgi:hypothetical protein
LHFSSFRRVASKETEYFFRLEGDIFL